MIPIFFLWFPLDFQATRWSRWPQMIPYDPRLEELARDWSGCCDLEGSPFWFCISWVNALFFITYYDFRMVSKSGILGIFVDLGPWTSYLWQKYFQTYKTNTKPFKNMVVNLRISNHEFVGTYMYQHFEIRNVLFGELRNSETLKLWISEALKR